MAVVQQIRKAMHPTGVAYHLFYKATVNSYAQIFFSKNRWLALLILAASFVDVRVGFSGLLAILLTNSMAYWLGLNQQVLYDGLFGTNSLFVSLALAAGYQFNAQYWVIFIIANVLTLLLSVVFMGLFQRVGLPFLSWPFLVAFWILLLAIRQYEAMELSSGSIYQLNDLYSIGGGWLVGIYEWMDNLKIPDVVYIYFQSLGAIILNYNLISGILIALGLLIASRILFSLSVVGFIIGYLYYYWIQGDITQLTYSYIGFNFILTSLALGGFFFIPNKHVLALVVIVTPIIAILIATVSAVFLNIQLPVFSAPFAIITLVVLYGMNFSTQGKRFLKVIIQDKNPERNIYNYRNNQKRFERTTWFHIGLPFFGEWLITQAHNGEHTHKGEWAQAWDFEVRGSNGKTFRSSGNFPEHYFCYNLPVIAAQAGYVVAVEDDIEDNEIGKPNMVKNWGNTVVIKHAEYLYTKVSHLKAGTIEVKVGDYVKKGDLLGNVGNSGRSPVPHLHFQIQATPYIGSKTLWYPIDYYVINNDGNHELHEFEIPQNQQLISSFKTNLLLKKNYEFVLGQKYKVEYEMNGKTYMENWEVFATSLGKKYVFCHETRALAYFVNDESNFYFTDYQGHRKGALYYYFLCSYKVMLGFYQGAQVRDSVALHQVYSQYALFAHDFVAPFTTLAQVHYELNYQHVDDPMFSREMLLNGKLSIKSIFNTRDFLHFELKIEEDAYQQLSVTNNKLNFKAKIISE